MTETQPPTTIEWWGGREYEVRVDGLDYYIEGPGVKMRASKDTPLHDSIKARLQ